MPSTKNLHYTVVDLHEATLVKAYQPIPDFNQLLRHFWICPRLDLHKQTVQISGKLVFGHDITNSVLTVLWTLVPLDMKSLRAYRCSGWSFRMEGLPRKPGGTDLFIGKEVRKCNLND
jgi:hypothetical protein